MIILNCYGLFVQARKRSILIKEQASNFMSQSNTGNTLDLSELESVRERAQEPRSNHLKN